MYLHLLASALLFASTPPPSARIWFDARGLQDRPLVRAWIAGHAQTLLLDTGSDGHMWSLRQARAFGVPFAAPRAAFRDFEGRVREASLTTASVTLEGLGPLGLTSLPVSEWADRIDSDSPDLPHTDGLLSPQLLAAPGHAILFDLAERALIDTNWGDALARLARPGWQRVADVPVDENLKFVVEAQVDGDSLRMAIDTGAPRSLVYRARETDLPADATRRWTRRARVILGALHDEVELTLLEPVEAPGFDGVIGMDVLRRCAMAFDPSRLVLSCANAGGAPPARSAAEPPGDASRLRPRAAVPRAD
jgi:hypothetical protein